MKLSTKSGPAHPGTGIKYAKTSKNQKHPTPPLAADRRPLTGGGLYSSATRVKGAEEAEEPQNGLSTTCEQHLAIREHVAEPPS